MPVANPSSIIDLSRDVTAAARMGASIERVDELLGEAIDTLGHLVPFDLATIMQLQGDELRVRVARGPLRDSEVARHRVALAEYPAIRKLIHDDRARSFTELDHRDGDGDPFDGVLDLPHGHFCMVVPLRGPSEAVGIMTFDRSVCGTYSEAVVALAGVFGKLMATAMTFGEQSARLSRLQEQLREQNRVLREGVSGRTHAGELMRSSRSASMVHVVELASQVAVTDTPVLVTGETGTGKEVLATAIHEWSRRADEPIVSLNCAALPPGLIESELFGHVRGAFSGATQRRIGRFQAANGGTLFLDEVGELPVGLQAKLLRALQDGCFEPVGSDRTVRVDVRVIAATNVDLLVAVADGAFRQDLYYRLAVFPIHLPPLRERLADVPIIAAHVLAALAHRTGGGPYQLSEESRRWLLEQPWPGNVRELHNTLERATILSDDGLLDLPSLAATVPAPPRTPWDPSPSGALLTLREMERRHIRRALEQTGGKLYGADGAAKLLGLNPNTLRSRMKKLGLGGARDFHER